MTLQLLPFYYPAVMAAKDGHPFYHSQTTRLFRHGNAAFYPMTTPDSQTIDYYSTRLTTASGKIASVSFERLYFDCCFHHL